MMNGEFNELNSLTPQPPLLKREGEQELVNYKRITRICVWWVMGNGLLHVGRRPCLLRSQVERLMIKV